MLNSSSLGISKNHGGLSPIPLVTNPHILINARENQGIPSGRFNTGSARNGISSILGKFVSTKKSSLGGKSSDTNKEKLACDSCAEKFVENIGL